MKFGLKEDAIRRMRDVFVCYPDVERVLLYGSRAKGDFKPGSDVDLTLIGDTLDHKQVNRIANELDDLLFPYTFDLSIFEDITNPALRAHIERVGKVFYRREKEHNASATPPRQPTG